MIKSLFWISFSIIILNACNNSNIEKKERIDAIYTGAKEVLLNYNNSLANGFQIPSKDSEFLQVKINTQKYKGKYYKIYYQNESYKFEESDPLCIENFYGSWVDSNNTFKKITSDTTIAEFRIVGNPRNEMRFFSEKNISTNTLNQEELINNYKTQIENNPSWKQTIVDKAKQNGKDYETQLSSDINWLISQNKEVKTVHNDRWKRNPRTGFYSYLIVILDSSEISNLPIGIVNISSETFTNPYQYFLIENSDNPKYITQKVDSFIKVKASPPLDKGIYVADHIKYSSSDYFNKYVNNSDSLKSNATFLYHQQDPGAYTQPLKNIPISENLLSPEFTEAKYLEYIKQYDNNKIDAHFSNSEAPGKTFGYDEQKKGIWFINPGSKDSLKKENIGIKTRDGFTYGKYTFKIKMAQQLNSSNLWTGLTNAVWMVTQSMESWNGRRTCQKDGYMPFYGAAEGDARVPVISYSEMDFEMVKAPEPWPESYYKNNIDWKEEDVLANKNKVMVTCTNFDMACKEPKEFKVGAVENKYQDHSFVTFRWNEYHNALHLKTAQVEDELFAGEYYYFQLEWKPKEIIWRIGPSKDKLRVVGYMNDNLTNIANNQMVCVITQEYHYSSWWPNSPFLQENIPFPAEDLYGILYSIEIE
ncbi:MAG: hypothetical protein JXR60_06795 [Bacteroidales bacterium]|nr:hypothetical protein [Bacteroidales bacterium]